MRAARDTYGLGHCQSPARCWTLPPEGFPLDPRGPLEEKPPLSPPLPPIRPMGPLGPPGPPGPPGPARKAPLIPGGTGHGRRTGRSSAGAAPLAVPFGGGGPGGLDVTSAERWRHSPLLTWGHPASHAVHGALLPREGNFELAPLEILPWEEYKGKSIAFCCEFPPLAGAWYHTQLHPVVNDTENFTRVSKTAERQNSSRGPEINSRHSRQQVTEAWATKGNHNPSTGLICSS